MEKKNVAPSHIALYIKGWTSRVLRQELRWLQKYKLFWNPSYFCLFRRECLIRDH
ncbi:MAG: transposase [Candidatus Hodarchaeales archaeon]